MVADWSSGKNISQKKNRLDGAAPRRPSCVCSCMISVSLKSRLCLLAKARVAHGPRAIPDTYGPLPTLCRLHATSARADGLSPGARPITTRHQTSPGLLPAARAPPPHPAFETKAHARRLACLLPHNKRICLEKTFAINNPLPSTTHACASSAHTHTCNRFHTQVCMHTHVRSHAHAIPPYKLTHYAKHVWACPGAHTPLIDNATTQRHSSNVAARSVGARRASGCVWSES